MPIREADSVVTIECRPTSVNGGDGSTEDQLTLHQAEQGGNMMRLPGIVALVALIAVLAVTAGGCCSLLESADQQPAGDVGATGGIAKPTLEQFLDADSKTGEFVSTSVSGDGDETRTQSGQFWVDGGLFRYDLYAEGEMIRSIITPDGETAYFCEVAEQTSAPAVAGVEYYLAEYSGPGGNSREDGIDEETGATRVVYEMKKTYTVPGSANSWYVEDITYLVRDDVVIGVISRGTMPEDDGSIGPLDTTRKMYSNVRAGIPIPAEKFELPYPIVEAE
jgi:outer membrane lipoprotein-sorting protein